MSDTSETYQSCKEGKEGSSTPSSNFSSDVPVFPAPSYIRAVSRRGNVYMVGESRSFDPTDQMIKDLYEETLNMSMDANKKARLLKFVGVLANIFLVISGSVIGVLTLDQPSNNSYYISCVLGFAITAVQSLMSMFSIEKRGILLKDISNSLRKISRQVKSLENSHMKIKDKKKKLEELYTEVDEIDMVMFDNNATSIPKHNEDQVSSSNSSATRVRPSTRFSTKQRDQIVLEMTTRE